MILNPFSVNTDINSSDNEKLYINTTLNTKTIDRISKNSLIIVGILSGYGKYGFNSVSSSSGQQTYDIGCSGIFIGSEYPNDKFRYKLVIYKTQYQTDELGMISYYPNDYITLNLNKYTFAYIKTFDTVL